MFYQWTKRLGQKHWAKSNSPTTICGKPMLGNNYASLIKEEDKTPCEECLTQIDTVDLNNLEKHQLKIYIKISADLNNLENNLKQAGLNVIVVD